MASYYIFGSQKQKIHTNIKKAIYKSSNFDECLEKFYNLTQQVEYNHLYLICDYEIYGCGTFFHPATIENDHEDILPFIIVAEWHFGDLHGYEIRLDHIELQGYGFRQIFNDNEKAIRNFEDNVNHNHDIQMNIIYNKDGMINGKKVTRKYKRKIADTQDIWKNIYSRKLFAPINWLVINSPKWDYIEAQ